MSKAPAKAEATEGEAPAKGGKKKLIIIIAAALLVVLLGAGAALFMVKKKAAAAEAALDEDEVATEAHADPKAKAEKRAPPVFVPLDPFTVNLADRDAERYAQIGVTLEIEDPKVGDELKLYMPAIRNNILMLLAHKTANELLSREGKLQLVHEIRREAMRPLGYELPDEEEEATDGKKRKRKKAVVAYPVRAVHFSNIIIQ